MVRYNFTCIKITRKKEKGKETRKRKREKNTKRKEKNLNTPGVDDDVE